MSPKHEKQAGQNHVKAQEQAQAQAQAQAREAAEAAKDAAETAEAAGAAGAADAAKTSGETRTPEQARITELEQQVAELKDRMLRVAAEYDNYRRRTAREKECLGQYATADTVAAFLPVHDNLLRALQAAEGADPAMKEGLDMVIRQFEEVMEKMGVTAIEAAGCPFDPDKHNAVMHVEDLALPASTVTEEFQKGYMLGDRVIRHSMVKVAN